MSRGALSLEELRQGDRRAVARWLSAADRGTGISDKQWAQLWEGAARRSIPVVGLSGPPGAGKSTLLRSLVHELGDDFRVLSLCIDPTSPVSGGALLGDRVRIQQGEQDQDIFIRSVGSHGIVGGVNPALDGLILVGMNGPFDVIIVEGVGAGQAEFALRDYVDFLCVLMVPESGDTVQLLKAGSLELADIVVLNKADRPDSETLWQSMHDTLENTKLVRTSALSGDGVRELTSALRAGFSELDFSKRHQKTLQRLASRRLCARVVPGVEQALLEALSKKLKRATRGFNPYTRSLSGPQLKKKVSSLVNWVVGGR